VCATNWPYVREEAVPSPLFYRTRLRSQGRLSKWREVRQAQWLSEWQVTELQSRLLTQLLRHAHAHVPYYTAVLTSAGAVAANGEVDLSRFRAIPPLTKQDIRGHFEQLQSDDRESREWTFNFSGGSTGEPIRIAQETRDDVQRAMTFLFDEWSGRRIGERQVRLWASPRDLDEHRLSMRARVRQRFRNQLWLDAFRMTPERMAEYVRTINEFRPVQILAYAGSLFELARFIERARLTVWAPAGVMTSAETLFPEQRRLLERVFRAPVFNRYGSREAGNMACECASHQGLHVAAPSHFIEILRPDGTPVDPGEAGEIVVTCLGALVMPLIRYRIGDIGSWAPAPCTCGRNWPLLKEISGRVNDSFALPDGGTITGGYFTMAFYEVDWIERFQVIQEAPMLLRVRMVASRTGPSTEQRESDLRRIDETCRLVLGRDCVIRHEFVDRIDASPSGKFRHTVSHVSQ
jgi:phenylacetate-coenzyme A ligase PaaK-like adenylate-forming protein